MSTGKPADLRSRTMLLIEAVTSPARRFKELDEQTAVSGATWRSFWNREGALPSGAMIEELSRHWPQYAFWLLTGIADWEFGHMAPQTATYLPNEQREEAPAAAAYFRSRIKTENPPTPSQFIQYLDGLVNIMDDQEATELLGGHQAREDVRKELEERGILEPRQPRPLHEVLSDTEVRRDPVLERAVEVLQRQKAQQREREFADLKRARDQEWSRHRSTNSTHE